MTFAENRGRLSRLHALMCILDHVEINLIFLGTACIEASNKTSAITCFFTGCFGKLFLVLTNLLEKTEKDILTTGVAASTAGVSFLLSGFDVRPSSARIYFRLAIIHLQESLESKNDLRET